jgi:hypothetical protein
MLWMLKSKSKLCYDRRLVGQSVLVWSIHLGLTARFWYLSDICRFVVVGRSLWRENGPAFYNCCWASPAQSFLGLIPVGLVTIFCCLRFENPPTGWTWSPFLYPPGTGWPSYTSRHRLSFSSPPIAGLRWRYSNPPPRGVNSNSHSEYADQLPFKCDPDRVISPPRTIKSSSLILCFIICHETRANLGAMLWFLQAYSLLRNISCLGTCYLSKNSSFAIRCSGNVVTEPLLGNGRPLWLSAIKS